VIKRIRFATKQRDVSRAAFVAAWRDAVAGVVDAPPEARPTRVTLCVTLPDVDGCDAKHEAISLEWFGNVDHFDRYHAWLDTSDGRRLARRIDAPLEPDASPLLLADERVMRGAEWLEQRWRDRNDTFKHMAVALRARGLTPAEFSELWKSRAGQVRKAGDDTVTVIPEVARGLAYVQNHPRPRQDGEWAYDALNEVCFDDLDSLRNRIDWFRVHLLDQPEDDLVRENWFIVAREEVVLAT
jgi:hypothetical protein